MSRENKLVWFVGLPLMIFMAFAYLQNYDKTLAAESATPMLQHIGSETTDTNSGSSVGRVLSDIRDIVVSVYDFVAPLVTGYFAEFGKTYNGLSGLNCLLALTFWAFIGIMVVVIVASVCMNLGYYIEMSIPEDSPWSFKNRADRTIVKMGRNMGINE